MNKLHLALLLPMFSLIGCANQAFYHPDRVQYGTPAAYGCRYEEVQFFSKDGTRLTGWFIPAQGEAKATIIHFHGNAQNQSAHYAQVSFLPGLGYNLFVFDYRGYGKSEGKPERKGVYEDCIAAIRYINGRADVDQDKLFILGQSLGGANAIAVAGNDRFEGVRGVISDSAFYSYLSIARDHANPFQYLFVPLVVSNAYSPGKAVGKISPTPILFIHGTNDKTVPYHHMHDLFAKAKEPKDSLTIENGTHLDAFTAHKAATIPRLQEFIKKCLERPGEKN